MQGTLLNSDFTVSLDGSAATIQSVTIVGNNVNVTLTEKVLASQTNITVTYNGTNLLDSNNNVVSEFTRNVTNNVSVPTVTSATIVSSTNTVEITFDEYVYGTPNNNDFNVLSGGNTITVSAVTVLNTNVTLTLNGNIKHGEQPTVSYTGTSLLDSNNNKIATFSDQSITNDINLSTVVVEHSSPNDLVLTYATPLTIENVLMSTYKIIYYWDHNTSDQDAHQQITNTNIVQIGNYSYDGETGIDWSYTYDSTHTRNRIVTIPTVSQITIFMSNGAWVSSFGDIPLGIFKVTVQVKIGETFQDISGLVNIEYSSGSDLVVSTGQTPGLGPLVTDDYNVTVDNSAVSISDISLNTPTNITLTLENPIIGRNQDVKVSYTQNANTIKDANDDLVFNFVDFTATNNIIDTLSTVTINDLSGVAVSGLTDSSSRYDKQVKWNSQVTAFNTNGIQMNFNYNFINNNNTNSDSIGTNVGSITLGQTNGNFKQLVVSIQLIIVLQ